jgi:hypothetical protein
MFDPRDVPTATIHVCGGDFFTSPRSEWDVETLRQSPSSIERTRELFRKWREADLARPSTSTGAR